MTSYIDIANLLATLDDLILLINKFVELVGPIGALIIALVIIFMVVAIISGLSFFITGSLDPRMIWRGFGGKR